MSRSVRALGVALVLAVAGAVGGYAVGASQTDEPVNISMALPVPAADPSYPVVEYEVEPDPEVAPLATGIALEETRLRAGRNKLEISIPRGWSLGGDVGRWVYSAPQRVENTYFLRVQILNNLRSQGVERDARIGALQEAEANDVLERVVIEDETDDGFVATYLQDGFQRVSMERFLPLGTTSTYLTVAVIGREQDREGMADLLERICASASIP